MLKSTATTESICVPVFGLSSRRSAFRILSKIARIPLLASVAWQKTASQSNLTEYPDPPAKINNSVAVVQIKQNEEGSPVLSVFDRACVCVCLHVSAFAAS